MSLPIPADSYDIDPAHSQLDFQVTHLGITTIRGRFTDLSGALTVGNDLDQTGVAIEVQTNSINTGHEYRDGHLQSDELFDVAAHPTMSFKSTGISESGSGYSMSGDLTIKGVTRPVTLDTTYNGEAVFPVDGSTHFGFSASTSIQRSSFGVDYGIPMVSDNVDLTLQVQFARPAAG